MPHILVERGLAYIGHLPYVMLLKIRMSKGKKLFTQFSNLHHTQMPTAYCSFENDSWLLIIQVHVVQVYISLNRTKGHTCDNHCYWLHSLMLTASIRKQLWLVHICFSLLHPLQGTQEMVQGIVNYAIASCNCFRVTVFFRLHQSPL